MPLSGVDVEVHGLAGPVIGLGPLHLVPELTVLRRAVPGIHLDRPGVDGGQEVEAQQRLGGGGEGIGDDVLAQAIPEKRGDGLADTGGIDDHLAALPDVP